MGKKSTTVETGLGDAQYSTITANQGSIANSIDNGFNAAAVGLSDLQTGQGTITGNQQTLADGQGTIIGNQTALGEGQTDILAAVQNAPQVDLSGVTSSIGALGKTTNAGFINMGTRFDTVDGSLGALQGSVNTGFGGVNEALDTGFGGVNDTLGTMGEDITTGFESVNNNVGTGFTEAETNRAAMQELLATGQITMQELVTQYGEAGAKYYADLAQNQSSLMDGQAGIQMGLSAFEDTYDQNVTMEAQRFGEMQDQITGGFDVVRDGQSNLSSAVTTAAEAPQAAAQAVSGAQGNSQSQAIDYARIAKEVATGVNAQSDQSFSDGNMFASKLDTIRTILTDQGQNLDANIRNQYTKLSNSFDDQGRLISSQVDSNGNQVARAIDQNGNLLMSAFDQQGQRIMQDSLNINQMMSSLDNQLSMFQVGSNYTMGNLSPARNRGLAAPYSRTY